MARSRIAHHDNREEHTMSTDRPMTKTEVREWIRRVREDLRYAEAALADGDLDALREAAMDASCALGEVQAACDEQGVRGLS